MTVGFHSFIVFELMIWHLITDFEFEFSLELGICFILLFTASNTIVFFFKYFSSIVACDVSLLLGFFKLFTDFFYQGIVFVSMYISMDEF